MNVDGQRDGVLIAWLAGACALAAAAWAGTLGHTGGFTAAQAFSNGWPPALWEMLTVLGDERVLLAIVLPFCWRHPKWFWGVILGALLAGVAGRLAKEGVAFPRPAGLLPEDQVTVIGHRLNKRAFPSGHTASVFSFACLVLAFHGRRIGAFALVVAAAAGFSRVAVGAHWPLDVLAGATIGCAGAWLAVWLLARPGIGQWGASGKPHNGLIVVGALAVASLPFEHQGYPDSLPLRVVVCLWGLVGLAIAWRQRSVIGADPTR